MSRTIRAYSKPTSTKTIELSSGGTYTSEEGVESVFYGYSSKSDKEIIEQCKLKCASIGLELGYISEIGTHQTGFYAGAQFEVKRIYG